MAAGNFLKGWKKPMISKNAFPKYRAFGINLKEPVQHYALSKPFHGPMK